MILADKIIKLRKQNGWSQEDLANQLNVSRQSVSKWESTASIPDMDKILKMSQVFGVSTDYLLKDDVEDVEYSSDTNDDLGRTLSLQDVNEYLEVSEKAYRNIAYGVLLCIFSPITLIGFMTFFELNPEKIEENVAVAMGLVSLFVFVLIGIILFISNGMKLSKYNYLEKEIISLEYGVSGIVEKRNEAATDEFTKNLIIGIVLIFVGVMQLVLTSLILDGEQAGYSVCILLLLIALGVYRFVYYGSVKESYSKLLQVEDYSVQRKVRNEKMKALDTAYWSIVTTVYLAVSFITFSWGATWIIWPVAGVLYGAIEAIFGSRTK